MGTIAGIVELVPHMASTYYAILQIINRAPASPGPLPPDLR